MLSSDELQLMYAFWCRAAQRNTIPEVMTGLTRDELEAKHTLYIDGMSICSMLLIGADNSHVF